MQGNHVCGVSKGGGTIIFFVMIMMMMNWFLYIYLNTTQEQ